MLGPPPGHNGGPSLRPLVDRWQGNGSVPSLGPPSCLPARHPRGLLRWLAPRARQKWTRCQRGRRSCDHSPSAGEPGPVRRGQRSAAPCRAVPVRTRARRYQMKSPPEALPWGGWTASGPPGAAGRPRATSRRAHCGSAAASPHACPCGTGAGRWEAQAAGRGGRPAPLLPCSRLCPEPLSLWTCPRVQSLPYDCLLSVALSAMRVAPAACVDAQLAGVGCGRGPGPSCAPGSRAAQAQRAF